MGKVIGIDLGTTNSLVATVRNGVPSALADDSHLRRPPCSPSARACRLTPQWRASDGYGGQDTERNR